MKDNIEQLRSEGINLSYSKEELKDLDDHVHAMKGSRDVLIEIRDLLRILVNWHVPKKYQDTQKVEK